MFKNKRDKDAFIKAIIITILCICLVAAGFIAAGYFSGRIR